MAFLQFPWRFLNYVGLFGAFLIGFLVWSVEQKKSGSIGMVVAALIIAATIFINGKLFSPQQIFARDVSYYTNPIYLRWTASKISDEYLPKSFGSPGTPQAAREYMARYKAPKEGLYKKISDGKGGYKFSSRQTTIEQVSNLLSVIGVVVLLVVIIGKRDLLYGKKAS